MDVTIPLPRYKLGRIRLDVHDSQRWRPDVTSTCRTSSKRNQNDFLSDGARPLGAEQSDRRVVRASFGRKMLTQISDGEQFVASMPFCREIS